MKIIDCHQDIILSTLYTTRTDFFRRNKLTDGSNTLALPVNNQTDYFRLRKGGVHIVFAAVCAFSIDHGKILPSNQPDIDTYCQINGYHELVRKSIRSIQVIRTKTDLESLKQSSIGFVLHVEGADMLARHEDHLNTLFNLGVRSVGLTWNYKNGLAAGAMTQGGLTQKGKTIIRRMEKLGMLLDLAHLNRKSLRDSLKFVEKPFILSHANCKSLYNHPRNIADEELREIKKRGGVVGMSGVPEFLGDRPTLEDLCHHIVHALEMCGENNVCIGSDFGAMTDSYLIPGFSQSSDFPTLVMKLKEKGIPQNTLIKICYKNALSLLKSVLPLV